MSSGRILLVDLGNTRLKWAWLDRRGRPGRMRATVHAAVSGSAATAATAAGRAADKEFAQLLPPLRRGDRVIAVSVAAPERRRRLAATVRRLAGSAPQFIRSRRSEGTLRNGYREPWRLGADRWAALAAARALQRAVLVVDAGTAVTIDLLGGDGRHHGGWILPGVRMMGESLLRGTGGIRRRAAATSGRRVGGRRGAVPFARSTLEAVEAGALLSISGAIERAADEARLRLGKRPRVLLTGGDADRLARRLRIRHELRPALVLEGLAQLHAALCSPSRRRVTV